MSLTQGLWKYNLWGEPSVSVPPGAELWAWYFNDKSDYENLWSQTTRALSGLFCASLNFMNNQTTVQPKYSFRPLGLVLNSVKSMKNEDLNKRVKYSSLPNEIVCTENLTPWLKLLPCGKYSGLAQLLANPAKLYDSKYHSLGIHIRHICLVHSINH